MSSNIAVCAKNLGKCFQIYGKPLDRLRQLFRASRKPLYREFWALRGVSFEVNKGEAIGIIGRNGSGKSTLLQLICGTLTLTEGEIEVNGRIAALLELGAGFNPEFTGRENVYMNAAIMGLSREEIDAKYNDIVAFAEIGDFIDQPVKTYSSGMFVRLAFAVVAHLDADILVIDEALAVGDAFFTQKCMRFLREFRERGTLLFVSHDSAAVTNLCRRAIWLEKGEVRRTGSAKEVCEAYLEAIFEAQQGPSAVAGQNASLAVKSPRIPVRDQRLAYVNYSRFRNDIEVFAFDPASGAFGAGGAKIECAGLASEDGMPLSWIVGGEVVVFWVHVRASREIANPIVGFFVKDRLGQTLFGDNTYLTYARNPQAVASGEVLEARFLFQIPILPAGEYSIAVAVAEGTQEKHVQHHWIHDALLFRSHSTSVCTGLVGIPMLDIQLTRSESHLC